MEKITRIYPEKSCMSIMDKAPVDIRTRNDLTLATKDFFDHVVAIFECGGDGDISSSLGLGLDAGSVDAPKKEDFLIHAEMGSMTIRNTENRPFSMSILQGGRWVRIGIATYPNSRNAGTKNELSDVFYNHPPVITNRGGRAIMYDWQFETPDFFTDLAEQLTVVRSVYHLYSIVADVFYRYP